MKKLFTLLLVLFTFNSHATQIKVEFDKGEYNNGDTVLANVWLSDYSKALTYFGFDAFFKASLLDFDSVNFSHVLDVDGSDAFGMAWLEAPGQVSLYNMFTSLVEHDLQTLVDTQAGKPLQLLTFKFTALADFINPSLQIANTDFTFEAPNQPPVIDPWPIPAPAGLLLLVPALALLRRRV